jgi:D-glucosaminate-6-phosphate ammonia-lyase
MVSYRQLEVQPVINATCHWTIYGGSVMWPEVLTAMAEARQTCVDMRQLLDRAGKAIAHYTHAEAGYVVSGCAAALQVGAAAILTGDDPVKMAALPHTAGLMKRAFIARRFARRRDAREQEYVHWGYAQAVRGAGGEFVEVGGAAGVTRAEFAAAFGPETAGVYWVSDGADQDLHLPEVIAIAHDHGVPVLVDAANTLPPAEHLYSFIEQGADLVAFSGGKGLRGPQGSGILAGRAELIHAARLEGAPVQGIGRPLKVSKEEVIGLLTALEIWTGRDHTADLRDARRRTDDVVNALAGLPGIRAEHRFPDHVGRPYPTVFIEIASETGLTGADVIARLLAGEPAVAVMDYSDPQIIRVDVRILTDEQTAQVAARLRQVLRDNTTVA